jgi:hypothetical protein
MQGETKTASLISVCEPLALILRAAELRNGITGAQKHTT